MREMSEDEFQKVTAFIFAGQKIQAIKLYSQSTGAGLKESKDYIDHLEQQLRAENAGNFSATAMPGSVSVPAMPEEDAKKMTDLIFAGHKLEAIKMYRDASRLGLRKSKVFIDDLEKQLRVECPENFTHAAKTGCGAVVLLGGLLALVVGTVAWA
jgi:ribosomal protein L7/L12